MIRHRVERSRITALQRLMVERNIEALLVTQRENVRYLTGFTGSSGSVVVACGKPLLITDFRYKIQARAEAPEVRVLIQKKDHFSAVKEAARRLDAKTLWFDDASLTIDRAKAIRKQGLRLKGITDPVAALRQRKDHVELTNIRKAILRAEESFRALKRFIKPGASEHELGFKLEMLIREQGARRTAFDIIVASGSNGAMPHASVTNRRLRTGDLVTFDFGAEADGYYCDITRTVCVGRPTSRQRLVYDLVLRAQDSAINAVRPGVRCAELDRQARGTIAKAGHGKHFGHATGHGIGLMVHEGPSLSALSKGVVDEGMVFTVEPGVYIEGWGGVRIEDMVLVTSDGHSVLTSLPRELQVVF
jgi:Xaa-Pro aminopeptidase